MRVINNEFMIIVVFDYFIDVFMIHTKKKLTNNVKVFFFSIQGPY